MDEEPNGSKEKVTENDNESDTPKGKQKPRGRKRKRAESDSESSDGDEEMPDHCIEVEKNLMATAAKNNLSDESVKKILKKVVTNDHVLALVKLREEEESLVEDETLKPKLTRAKAKALEKESPTQAAWPQPGFLTLTPIKHIPVKTTPEVTALIAHDMPDESDEEYQPTHEDAPSDDDQTLESCSDLDSQPRTPATPSTRKDSPTKDGLFKVPTDIKTPKKREKDEATIAKRTRSKLCLSSTSIEHIESSFVPPDEPTATGEVDDLWSDFLKDCFTESAPAALDDDEADPEYNVLADQDITDDDEENARLQISRKEINDLITALLDIDMYPENIPIPAKVEPIEMNEHTQESGKHILEIGKLHNSTGHQITENGKNIYEIGNQVYENHNQVCESGNLVYENGKLVHKSGKQVFENAKQVYENGLQVLVDEIVPNVESTIKNSGNMQENNGEPRVPLPISVGKREENSEEENNAIEDIANTPTGRSTCKVMRRVEESGPRVTPPPLLRDVIVDSSHDNTQLPDSADALEILPMQVELIQQQLRQHVQICASNFCQLFSHPEHWSYAPSYKEYLFSLKKMVDQKPDSIVNVCNLQQAVDLCESWEKSMSEDTDENRQIVEYLQKEAEKCKRRNANNSLYIGEFHSAFYQVIANSPVFLYPYLLPPVPYRCDKARRNQYLPCEDELFTHGLDMFWRHVERNPDVFKPRMARKTSGAVNLRSVIELMCQHMFPWLSQRTLSSHIANVRGSKDMNNPILQWFTKRELNPVKHSLLAYNPNMTLLSHPEHEIPLIWLKYLSKTSTRHQQYIHRRAHVSGNKPTGVSVDVTTVTDPITKTPEPVQYRHMNIAPRTPNMFPAPGLENNTSNIFSVVQTPIGSFLMPLPIVKSSVTIEDNVTITVPENNDNDDEIIMENEVTNVNLEMSEGETENENYNGHCKCCYLLRKITKIKRQRLITDYIKDSSRVRDCCVKKPNLSVTNKLKVLLSQYKSVSFCVFKELQKKIKLLQDKVKLTKSTQRGREVFEIPVISDVLENICKSENNEETDFRENMEQLNDTVLALSFISKLNIRLSLCRQAVTLKRSVKSLMHRFEPNSDCPAWLFKQMEEILSDECSDLSMEFLQFLTGEHADSIGRYRDYFVQTQLNTLVKTLQASIKDEAALFRALVAVSSAVGDRASSSCQICCKILPHVGVSLAPSVYQLFPHQATPTRDAPAEKARGKKDTAVAEDNPADLTSASIRTRNESMCSRNYEADHSSSGEESEDDNLILSKLRSHSQNANKENDDKTTTQSNTTPKKKSATSPKSKKSKSKSQVKKTPEKTKSTPKSESPKTKMKVSPKSKNPKLRRKTTITQNTKKLTINLNPKKIPTVKKKVKISPKSKKIAISNKTDNTQQSPKTQKANVIDNTPKSPETLIANSTNNTLKCPETPIANLNKDTTDVPKENESETNANINELCIELTISKTENQDSDVYTEYEYLDSINDLGNHSINEKQNFNSNQFNLSNKQKDTFENYDKSHPENISKDNIKNAKQNSTSIEYNTINKQSLVAENDRKRHIKTNDDENNDCKKKIQKLNSDPKNSKTNDTHSDNNNRQDNMANGNVDNINSLVNKQIIVSNNVITSKSDKKGDDKNKSSSDKNKKGHEENEKGDDKNKKSCDNAHKDSKCDDDVKFEEAEWSRDEDKLILQVLKDNVSPAERKGKTIMEILEEKNVFELLSDSLLHKSLVEIRDRIIYLLELLVFADSCNE